MKRTILGLAVCAIAATSCKKNLDQQFGDRSTHAGPFLGTVTLSGLISADRTLSADTLYLLDGKVFVTNHATLTIEPGARIEGIKKSTPALSSALVVTRGAKIEADGGDASSPIIFTSHEASPASGDWGGVVLLGRAPINKPDTTIEGIVPGQYNVDVKYGGGGAGLGDSLDNSGTLRYVRIEYAGAKIADANELNGLTCGGVGAGTTIDFVEAYKGLDDAFEFFGGTVHPRHLVAFGCDDDEFDTDFGFKGSIQFAVALRDPNKAAYSSDPNGIEADNDGQGSSATPRSKPVFSNLTVIGFQDSVKAGTAGKNLLYGARLRRNTSYMLRNSIFMGYPTGIVLESAGTIADSSSIRNNLVQSFRTRTIGAALTSSALANNFYLGFITNANSPIQLAAPFATSPDFRPLAGSPALTAGTNYTGMPSYIQNVAYRGAFSQTDNWISGWTRFN